MECGVLIQLDGAKQTVLLFIFQYTILRKVRSCNVTCTVVRKVSSCNRTCNIVRKVSSYNRTCNIVRKVSSCNGICNITYNGHLFIEI